MSTTEKVVTAVTSQVNTLNCLQIHNQEKTIAVLEFAQTILQDKMAQEIFGASDLEECLRITSESFTSSKILDAFKDLVKKPKKYFQIFSKFDYEIVIDVVQNAHSFSHLYYLQQINSFEGSEFQEHSFDFAKENDAVFRELITFVQSSKFVA